MDAEVKPAPAHSPSGRPFRPIGELPPGIEDGLRSFVA